jgi:two-component system, NarL family, sensor kinase
MLREDELILLVEIVSILIVVLAALTISLVYIDKNRKLKHGQEVLRSQLELQEQSLDNIYREIHDNIGQALSLAKLHLYSVEPELPEQLNEKVRSSKELVGKAITDLRNLSKNLNTEIIMKFGLHEAVRRELSSMDKNGQYQTSLSEKGLPYRLDEQKELVIFRIFQQHLNNIVPYSKPRKVNVELEYQPEHLSLAVSDDGRGLNGGNAEPEEEQIKTGIRNMQDRASRIGADLQFTTFTGGGTRIFIDLPLK